MSSLTSHFAPLTPRSSALAPPRAVPDPSAMDIVFIEDLRIDTVIGIYDWERRVRQTLAFDIEMAFDNTRPAASDDIADTLNYKDVSKRLMAYVGESSFGLVETLAERCAAIIREEFGVSLGAAEAVQARCRARRQVGRACASSAAFGRE